MPRSRTYGRPSRASPAGNRRTAGPLPAAAGRRKPGIRTEVPPPARPTRRTLRAAPGSAARQQEGSEDEQGRSQDQQEDKDASGRDAEKDAADERKDASDTEREQQDQDKQDERDAGEDEGGPEDEAAQEPEKQAGEQERREDEGAAEATRRQAPAPGTVDRSGAEPGEKSRTGGDTGTARAVGDPENEQDADDEPLGLDAEPAQDDTEREAGDDAAAAGEQPVPDVDLVGYTDAAKNPGLVEERRKGTAPLPSLSLRLRRPGAGHGTAGGHARHIPGRRSAF